MHDASKLIVSLHIVVVRGGPKGLPTLEVGGLAQNMRSLCNEADISLAMAYFVHPMVEFKLLYSNTNLNLPTCITTHVDYR